MSEYVPAELRRLIRERAGHRCEYCLLHEDSLVRSLWPEATK
jgi:hypothetical protein